jgi:hypothetical protein
MGTPVSFTNKTDRHDITETPLFVSQTKQWLTRNVSLLVIIGGI